MHKMTFAATNCATLSSPSLTNNFRKPEGASLTQWTTWPEITPSSPQQCAICCQIHGTSASMSCVNTPKHPPCSITASAIWVSTAANAYKPSKPHSSDTPGVSLSPKEVDF